MPISCEPRLDLDELNQVEASIRPLRRAIEMQPSAIPWSFRKAGHGSRTTRRELVLRTSAYGYVALYEIEWKSRVQVLAVRHQLEPRAFHSGRGMPRSDLRARTW